MSLYEMYADMAGTHPLLACVQEVMECYRRLFAKNGMPEGMIEDQLASIEPQFQAMPVVSLKSVIGSLKTQL